MSAARAAARNKPVLAIKTGRVAESVKATASHTGTLAGTDAVYDGALRRAGMLRVYDLEEMFTAVETLSHFRPIRGNTLTLLSNSGAIGIMALDTLGLAGGRSTELAAATVDKLTAILGDQRLNPIDLGDNAAGARYAQALDILFEAPEVDSVLIMHAPTAITSPIEIAEQVIKTVKAHRAHAMACWVGHERVQSARTQLHEAGIPTYETPGAAVRAFLHLADYRKNQDLLMETPPSALDGFVPDMMTARRLVANAVGNGDGVLAEPHAKALLRAYGIPAVDTHFARTADDAQRIAGWLAGPVALKIMSPDVPHKSQAGGVMLNLQAPEVAAAANLMLDRVTRKYPEARLQGFTVEQMAERPGAQELIVGVTTDSIFGPVIMFGQGGTAVEVLKDSVVGLPPLNMTLARELVQRTRAWKLLQGYGGVPPANLDEICLALMKVSQMIVDIPEITELDINPLFADAQGVLALDVRIQVNAAPPVTHRLAIRPYPKELEEVMALNDGRTVFVRPIRPEDEPRHHHFVSKLTPEDIRFRFFGLVKELPHSEMARFTQIDYDREMAFIAVRDPAGQNETVGVVRAVADPDNERAEFAVVVSADLKGTGLARKLMMKMIVYCLQRGIGQLVGQVLTDNVRMLKFVDALGFKRIRQVEGDIVEVALDLRAPALAVQQGVQTSK
jgi:acetyltransferase